jgi:uncharacterized protein (DUF885 family)
LAACQESEPQQRADTKSKSDATQRSAELLREFTDGYYGFYPTLAVISGLHEYDGQLPDFSPEGVQRTVTWLEEMRRRTAAIDAERLGPKERLYHGYLAAVIDTELFNIQTLKAQENNTWYGYLALDPNLYLSREYAPLAVRMAAYIRHVEGLPAAAAAMRRTLKPMPSGHARGFQEYLNGMAEFVTTVPYDVFSEVDDPARQTAMRQANDRAAAALMDLARWIEASPRNEAFALGPAKYAEMLWALERIDVPIEELKALAERDLERNMQSLQRACESFAPGSSLGDCRTRVASRKPADGPIAAASRQLDRLKQLILDRGIVSIPSDLIVIVAEAPPHQRSATAYIAVPGPHETGLPSIYYISPPDPSWPAEEQHQYLQSEADLMSTSTHCVWSGHILETLRSNRSDNPLAAFTYSYAYTEGWSSYSEEMMLHEALDDDPELTIGQLQNALLGNVRILASIGLHTGGMSVAEAEQLFRDKAFADPQNARQEAVRGTFDPGYIFYSLGKLLVRKLRDDWLADHPESSLRDFHDAFLSYGNPPIALLRKFMLGDADDGRLFH